MRGSIGEGDVGGLAPDLLLQRPSLESSHKGDTTSEEKTKSLQMTLLKPRLRLKKPSPLAVDKRDSKETQDAKSLDKPVDQYAEGSNKKHNRGSEALNKSKADEELDAPIEEHIILQMPTLEMSRHLRSCLADKNLIHALKLTFTDHRHAFLLLNGQKLKAKLYDLPCIIESQRAYDNKQFNKVADVCQMLVVDPPGGELPGSKNDVAERAEEGEHKRLKTEPQNYNWDHGITAPLWNVRKRRFCKRLPRYTVEEIERNIIRLLEADNEAEQVWFEMSSDEARQPKKKVREPEVPDLETRLSADEDMDNKEESIDFIDAAIEEALVRQSSQAAAGEESHENSDNGDESENSDYDNRTKSLSEALVTDVLDNSQEEIGYEEQRQKALDKAELLKDEIHSLERKLSETQSRLSELMNPIMKNRFEDIIKRINASIEEKRNELTEINDALEGRIFE